MSEIRYLGDEECLGPNHDIWRRTWQNRRLTKKENIAKAACPVAVQDGEIKGSADSGVSGFAAVSTGDGPVVTSGSWGQGHAGRPDTGPGESEPNIPDLKPEKCSDPMTKDPVCS